MLNPLLAAPLPRRCCALSLSRMSPTDMHLWVARRAMATPPSAGPSCATPAPPPPTVLCLPRALAHHLRHIARPHEGPREHHSESDRQPVLLPSFVALRRDVLSHFHVAPRRLQILPDSRHRGARRAQVAQHFLNFLLRLAQSGHHARLWAHVRPIRASERQPLQRLPVIGLRPHAPV